MPVNVAVNGDQEYGVIVYRFFGTVGIGEIKSAVMRAFDGLTEGVPYCSLLIFEMDTDLSEIDQNSLGAILTFGNTEYRKRKLGPRAGAAVLNGSADANFLLPLFNAMGLSRGGVDFSFKIFSDTESALNHLAVPLETGKKLIGETA